MLSFQQLHVYQRAIQFLALVYEIVDLIPKGTGNGTRVDQLVDAAESVVRNIAEGSGRWSTADSIKHFRISRGEAMESASSLDILRLRKLVSEDHYHRGISLLVEVVNMLTAMCRNT